MSRTRFFLAGLILAAAAASVEAQELEPRSFSQTPIGMNFGALAAVYADGNVLFDRSTTLEDVTGQITSVAAGYVRSIDFFGASATVSATVPYMWGDWEGKYQGEAASTSRRGFGDPVLGLAVNFIGAPAMEMKEMRGYHQKWVVGASLLATVPVGQYDPTKLLNLGANRWAVRPRVGASRKTGALSLEAMGNVWLYADNTDFLGGNTLSQDPLWSVQFNAIYELRSHIWFGLGAGGSRGGKAATNDVYSDTYKKNTRGGAVVSAPLSKHHSLKLMYIKGLRTRIGSDFDQLSLNWVWRWGGEG